MKQKKRVAEIIEKVNHKFFKIRAEQENRSIVNVNNKVLSLDKEKNQKEIYSGRYTLKINSKMPFDIQI